MSDRYPNMALTDREFYKQACRWADANSIQTAMKWWQAFVEVIVREEYYNGTCRVPLLGTFGTKTIKENYQKQTGPDGKEIIYRVPERELPTFTPHDDFINDVNCQGVTKAYRKRLKSNQLTQRDMERIARAEIMKKNAEVTEDQLQEAKENFKEMLKEKRKKYKGKVDPIDEEE